MIHWHGCHVHTVAHAGDDATHEELTEGSVWISAFLERGNLDDDADDDAEAAKNARLLPTLLVTKTHAPQSTEQAANVVDRYREAQQIGIVVDSGEVLQP